MDELAWWTHTHIGSKDPVVFAPAYTELTLERLLIPGIRTT